MTLRLAMFGDSIAYGMGATRTADTLAARLAADLAEHGVPTESRVFAVPGADSSGLGRQVAEAAAWRPELAVVVIGANDLTHLVPIDLAAARLGQAVLSLRRMGAQVVVAPAPDLSIVAHVPVSMRELVRAGSRVLRRAQVNATLAAGGRIADPDASTSEAFAADSALFSADRFHPSSAGYALIAAALAPAVRAAADELGAQHS